MLDIDFLKKVNDINGQDVDDLLIKNLAGMLREDSGNRDIVARIGGEEFCILTPGTTKKEVIDRFENLRRKIEETPVRRLKDKTPLFVTTSIGICSERGESLELMMKIADECLYKAKGRGRNCLEA